MFRLLFLMLLLLAGLIAGPYLAGKQGYVLISSSDYDITMSITTLVILFVASLGIIYLIEFCITRFLRLSNHTYSWFSRRKTAKAQKQTLEGLMRMNEGDYSKAEKLIGKNAKHSAEPVLNLIKAAEAAQLRGDEFSANRYLIEATELAGTDNLLVEIVRTRILLQQGKLPAARSSIDSLLELAPRNQEVLKLAVDIYFKSKAYQALDNILPSIESTNLYSASEFEQLQRRVEDGLLDEKMNEEGVEGLLAWWNAQPRRRHNDLYVKVGMIQRLIESNDHESAYNLTLDAMKKMDDGKHPLASKLCQLITQLQPEESGKLVKTLTKWATTGSSVECCANRALGYLYARENNFAKAAEAFKTVVDHAEKLQPNDLAMAAYAFEKIGDQAMALQLREQGLQKAMSVSKHSSSSPKKEESLEPELKAIH